MTLLEDIQSSAVDAKSDLATLLRKCKLLAARLGSQPLEDWVVWESNGYPNDAPVPDYRIWPLQMKGHFWGPYGSRIEYASIPFACLPEKARKHYERYECRQSIAGVEAILNNKPGTVRVSTGDLALLLGGEVYEHHNCVQAWGEFSTGQVVELLNSVRNRILDFALALWKEAPNAGEIDIPFPITMESKRVTQIFNTTVFGGSANLVGTSNDSSIEFNIGSKDFVAVEKVLIQNRVAPEDVAELRQALETDPAPPSAEKFGPKVSNWIAKMVGKAASGGWNLSLGAAGNLLAQLVSRYYGL